MAGPHRNLTLADIAKLAGVSRSAASRALDARAPVGGEKADRVRAVAAAHGYVPNSWAANLRRQKSGIIGVVVPRLTDAAMSMLYEEIALDCSRRGLHATVITTGDDPRLELERGKTLINHRIDGMILTTARTDGSDPLLYELQNNDIPYVLALRTDGKSPSSIIDDEHGGYISARHLIENGHRRVGYIGGPQYASTTQNREAGYRRALAEVKIEISPELIHYTNFSMGQAAEAAHRLFALADPPTAIFAANDAMAVSVIASAEQAGMRVPDSLSVTGYVDSPLAKHLSVPLTSVQVSFPEVAKHALDLLLNNISEDEPFVRITRPTLVKRESVRNLID